LADYGPLLLANLAPQSRWQALSQAFAASLLVGGLGSLLGLFRHILEAQSLGTIQFPVFFIYALGLVLAQFLLAVPACVATMIFVMSDSAKRPQDSAQDQGDQT